ncbi:MAG: response regulator [Bacteroidales bacterium]|nr:response regulator [Bacteroidales bacterium]
MINPKSIVLLEDEAPLRNALKKLLEAQNYFVRDSTTIASARNAIVELEPDLIIMDVMLPDGNSSELIEEVLAMEKFRNTPIIQMSGIKKEASDLKNALELGAIHYMTKPIQISEFIDKISLIFRVSDLERKHRDLEKRYNHIFTYSNDPIITINQTCDIISCNEAFEHLLANKEVNILKMNINDLFNDKNKKKWNEMFSLINEIEKIPSFTLDIFDYYKNTSTVEVFLSKSFQNKNWEPVYLVFLKEKHIQK